MEKKISSEIAFECPIFRVEHSVVELKDGQQQDRWYVLKNDAVAIIAVNNQQEILLTKEYRSALGEVSWRIPAGGLEDNEQPEAGARRELREETGFDTSALKLLKTYKSPSAWIKQATHFFVASELFHAPLATDELEQIELVPTSLDGVTKLLENGEIKGNIGEALKLFLQQHK